MKKVRKSGYTCRQRIKRNLLLAVCIAVVGIAAALIIYFSYIIRLRTQYRAFAMEVNDTILSVPAEEVTVRQGTQGNAVQADESLVEYYNIFLLDGKTVVFNKKHMPADDTSIILTFRDCTLTLTGLEDGSAVNLHWETLEKEEFYTVRAQITFQQLQAYLRNYLIRKEAEKNE